MDATPKNFSGQKGPATAPFPHREDRVGRKLGLSRDAVRALRVERLTENVHWGRAHNCVMLNDAAVDILRAAVQLSRAESPLDAPGAENGAPAPATAPCDTVKRVHLIGPEGNPGGVPRAVVKLKAWDTPANHCILVAYLPGTDPRNRQNLVRVRVTNNVNFVRHMELEARLVSPPDLYECTRPGPRERGRW